MHDLGLIMVTAAITTLLVWPVAVREGEDRFRRRFLRHVERQRERTS